MVVVTELVGSFGGSIPPVSFSYTESSTATGTYPIITIPAPASGRYAFIVHVETASATTTSAYSLPRMLVTGSSVNYYAPSGVSDTSRTYSPTIAASYGAMFPGFATGPITLNAVRTTTSESGNASCSGRVYFMRLA